MVNMGQIHKELGKVLMISSNLIKSENESMIEFEENDILWKRTSRRFHKIKKTSYLTLISRRNWRSKWDDFSEIVNRENTKIWNEIKEIEDSKIKLNRKRR